jgi:hypothetical protein
MIQNTTALKDLLTDQDSHENMWTHRARTLHLPRLKYGYYATALSAGSPPESHTTLTWQSRYSSLLRKAVDEIDWFVELEFHDQLSRCTSNSIVIALQRIYLTQLRSTWCPSVFRFLEDDRNDHLQRLGNLGLPPPPKYDHDVYQVSGCQPKLKLTCLVLD